jgi:NADH-quinone oxidoreductase subunit F
MDDKILTRDFGVADLHDVDVYLSRGGYAAVGRALKMTSADVLGEVKKANLRGRGGAGFPAGVKWGFVPQNLPGPRYMCVNADEGEPGTFKDRYIMLHDPHLLLEGIVIASYAVGIHTAYIYIRGEYETVALRLEKAIAGACLKNLLGKNILGSGFDLDVFVHRGAGAYICGEETALLDSLEGKRGHPRLKPPFPAVVGLFDAPTVINNIETLANVPSIILNGAEWFVKRGLPKDGGTRLFGISGKVNKPGVYELSLGTSLRTLIEEHAGGMKEGCALKAVVPGGLSAPILTAEEIDLPMDFDSLAGAGSMLGSGAVVVIDRETRLLDVLGITAKFYAHESCGQCTPCRIGTAWIHKIVTRMSEGRGERDDIDTIISLASNIKGKTECPLGDAAAMPILAICQKFRSELEQRLR